MFRWVFVFSASLFFSLNAKSSEAPSTGGPEDGCSKTVPSPAKASEYFLAVVDDPNSKKGRHTCAMEGSCKFKKNGKWYVKNGKSVKESTPEAEDNETNGKNDRGAKGAKDNDLKACESIAADAYWPIGAIIYFPELKGAPCPNGHGVSNGKFIVADRGGDVKGHGRFDFFIGECGGKKTGTIKSDQCDRESAAEFRNWLNGSKGGTLKKNPRLSYCWSGGLKPKGMGGSGGSKVSSNR